MFGDGYLRVGCEIYSLDAWIANAERIDALYGDGISHKTRALATKLKREREEAE